MINEVTVFSWTVCILKILWKYWTRTFNNILQYLSQFFSLQTKNKWKEATQGRLIAGDTITGGQISFHSKCACIHARNTINIGCVCVISIVVDVPLSYSYYYRRTQKFTIYSVLNSHYQPMYVLDSHWKYSLRTLYTFLTVNIDDSIGDYFNNIVFILTHQRKKCAINT